jgi:DNA-binding NarL/FixJ family response regulator
MSTPISIVIAEDDALLRGLLADILEREGDLTVVGCTEDGPSCLASVREHSPQVLLLDLHLPGMSGHRVLQHLAEQEESPRVLVLSGDDSVETQVEAARNGASGFLPKREAVSRLAHSIRAVAAGELCYAPPVAERVFREHRDLVRQVRAAENPLGVLSAKEQAVLLLVARGLTNVQIGTELGMSIHTVKLHVQNILRKLHLPNRTEAAVWAVRMGLPDQKPPDGGGLTSGSSRATRQG